MIAVGRSKGGCTPLAGRVDPSRLLHYMTQFTPQMDSTLVIWTGVLQGLGLGLVFVPLSTIAFATIEPVFRADATSLFSLVRNIGSSIGISMVTLMLTRNVQVNHADLGTAISPYNPNFNLIVPPGTLTAAPCSRWRGCSTSADDHYTTISI